MESNYTKAVFKFNKTLSGALAGCFLLGVAVFAVQAQEPAPSVREIMKQQVDPNAKAIWDAVSYVATVEGVQENSPGSAEEWNALRSNAVALMEAARQLKQPGLRVDYEALPEDYPQFQYKPEEIEALMQSQTESWLNYLEAMEAYTLQTMSAIQRQDTETFSEVNARINEACQDCHASFWYRPD